MFKALLEDAFPLIEKSAPVLASILGNPALGIPATIAIQALGKAFGIDSKSESFIADIQSAISTNPNSHTTLADLESKLLPMMQNSLKISNAELTLHVQWVDGSLKCST